MSFFLFGKKRKNKMSKPLLNNKKILIDDIVSMMEDPNLSIEEIVMILMEGQELTMSHIDKVNKILLKKYGKNKLKVKRFPVDESCPYGASAHNCCICLYTYVRPDFINVDDFYKNEMITLL